MERLYILSYLADDRMPSVAIKPSPFNPVKQSQQGWENVVKVVTLPISSNEKAILKMQSRQNTSEDE